MSSTQAIYKEKAKFLCQRCGNCCRWHGMVKLANGEAERIAAFLGVGVEQFIADCTELHLNRICLVLKMRANGECWFLEGKNVCQINSVKPMQCDEFPNKWNFHGWREQCAAAKE